MKFGVYTSRNYSGYVEVEASNKEEALEKVQAMNPDNLSFDTQEFTADFAREIKEN